MWKYINKKQCNDFLLSLNLIDNGITDKEKIIKLYTISNKIEDNYKIIKIKKRNGKYRTIYEPNYILKRIQKQILKNILEDRKISKYAKAYHKGISLKDNALPHIDKNIILKLDIKHFFDSISFYDIYNSSFPIDFFPKSVGMILTYLCSYEDYLPQGTPTASYISNLVMRDFDNELGCWCENKDIAFTRYSDDMTFSGDFNPKEVIKKVNSMLTKMGLTLNKDKIHIVNKNNKQNVTGIIVNRKLNTDIKYRKKIRQEIYFIKKYGIDSHLKRINKPKDEYLSSLYGRINYILQIDSNKEFNEYKKYLKELIKS